MAGHTDVNVLPDAKGLRSVLGSFATGITVVTTEHAGEYHGMTANSFTSVSLEPPLVLVCFTQQSRTALAVEARGEFVVNILDEGQASLSSQFARPAADHFENARYRLDDHGLPIMLGGLAHLACTVHETHEGGDHDIVIGRVRHAAMRDGSPLVFFRGAYRQLAEEICEAAPVWWYS